ncbi:MAG: hypothetical protein AAGE65_04755 [Planctomycetota bacterium]
MDDSIVTERFTRVGLAALCFAIVCLGGCDGGSSTAGREADSDDTADGDGWVEPPAPPISSTPISQRYGIDWPQDMGETFTVAFIEWDADGLAELLVEEHGGQSQNAHRTIGDAFEAGAEQFDWGSNYLHGDHALLLQFKDHYHSIWLFCGPHIDKLKELSNQAEVWVYAYDDDFSGADSLTLFLNGEEAGMMMSSEIGRVRGDFNGIIKADRLEHARELLGRINGDELDAYGEAMDAFELLIGEVAGDAGLYLPRFDNAGDESKHWLTPRTAGGDADVRTVRLVKF